MSISRIAVAGAVVLNVPTIFAASTMSATATAIAAVVLAVIGATLGAVTAWAITSQQDAVAVSTPAVAPASERLAA